MTNEELSQLDVNTIELIIKDAQKTHIETLKIGQPYTVRHFENLAYIGVYLGKVLDKIAVGARR